MTKRIQNVLHYSFNGIKICTTLPRQKTTDKEHPTVKLVYSLRTDIQGPPETSDTFL